MSAELFRIVLPPRCRWKNGLTAAALDVLLDVLLGCPTAVKKTVHDIVTFARTKRLRDADQVSEVVERMETAAGQPTGEDFCGDVLVHAWRRQQAFVTWLETVRACISQLSDLVVESVDSVGGSLADGALYYFHGEYYGRSAGTTYRSPHFRDVVEAVWQQRSDAGTPAV